MNDSTFPNIRISPDVLPFVRLGIVFTSSVVIHPTEQSLMEQIASISNDLRNRMSGLEPKSIPEIQATRELYRTFGVDPTKVRPSSESLLRRVLKSQPFPLINNAVDLGNLTSLKTFLSLGLYDFHKIKGEISLRRGLPQESYVGIRKNDVHLEGRLTLADSFGAFGNPTSDSLRTSVDNETTSLLVILFSPSTYSMKRLQDHAATLAADIDTFLASPKEHTHAQMSILPP